MCVVVCGSPRATRRASTSTNTRRSPSVSLSTHTPNTLSLARAHTHTSLKIHNSKLKLAHIQKSDVYMYIEMYISGNTRTCLICIDRQKCHIFVYRCKLSMYTFFPPNMHGYVKRFKGVHINMFLHLCLSLCLYLCPCLCL